MVTSGGSKVVYLCQYEGILECIYMGYLGLFIHSGFGDRSVGSVLEVTDQEILIFTIEDHLAQLYF